MTTTLDGVRAAALFAGDLLPSQHPGPARCRALPGLAARRDPVRRNGAARRCPYPAGRYCRPAR